MADNSYTIEEILGFRRQNAENNNQFTLFIIFKLFRMWIVTKKI